MMKTPLQPPFSRLTIPCDYMLVWLNGSVVGAWMYRNVLEWWLLVLTFRVGSSNVDRCQEAVASDNVDAR